jgi:CRP/FNR family transcriptional regulator, cyclic AMP receptor protein
MTKTAMELLKGLEPEDAAALVALGTRLTLPAGSVLFTLGAEADNAYAIESGRVSLTLPMQVGGREQDVLVEERSAGETVGWSALVPPHRFTLTAKTLIDSEVIAFSRAALLEHFASRPEVGLAVTRNLSAVMGQRLQVLQAMWLREIQRVVHMTVAAQGAPS